MPYLVASLIAIVTAMVIIFGRYEADNSLIKAEIEKMKNMYSLVDSYVNIPKFKSNIKRINSNNKCYF